MSKKIPVSSFDIPCSIFVIRFVELPFAQPNLYGGKAKASPYVFGTHNKTPKGKKVKSQNLKRPGEAEANVVVPARRREAATISGTNVPRPAAPATAANDTAGSALVFWVLYTC